MGRTSSPKAIGKKGADDRKIRILAVQVRRTNGSSSVGRLQWCCGAVPYVVAVQRVVLAEHGALVECAVLADDAVLAPGAGPRTTGRPSFRPESSAHSTRAVARSIRCSRAKAAGPWCHPAAPRAATM